MQKKLQHADRKFANTRRSASSLSAHILFFSALLFLPPVYASSSVRPSVLPSVLPSDFALRIIQQVSEMYVGEAVEDGGDGSPVDYISHRLALSPSAHVPLRVRERGRRLSHGADCVLLISLDSGAPGWGSCCA